jgi:hypothetical protein
MQRLRVADHRENKFSRFSNSARSFCPSHSRVQQRLRFRARAVVSRKLVAGVQQSPRYPATHRAEANKTNIRRRSLLFAADFALLLL